MTAHRVPPEDWWGRAVTGCADFLDVLGEGGPVWMVLLLALVVVLAGVGVWKIARYDDAEARAAAGMSPGLGLRSEVMVAEGVRFACFETPGGSLDCERLP